jgi:hypothetical protein
LASFQFASKSLNIIVEEPIWIELSRPDPNEMVRAMEDATRGCPKDQLPQMALVLLNRENDYRDLKNKLLSMSILSQAILFKTAKKKNASVSSNILKQMTTKMGGSLYHLKFGPHLSPNTMLIGIDVCHKSAQSIVGFVATIDKNLSQYYSQVILQKKGQEIVDQHLTAALHTAIETYRQRNKGLPDHFIIFRDGVGDGQRKEVLNSEVSQMRQAINDFQNKAAKAPHITVVVVNKRIQQRFFVEDGRGSVMNPPSGCLIDSGLVAKEGSDEEFDFYLVPQTTTQGCITPTHFYVPLNESPLTKTDIT